MKFKIEQTVILLTIEGKAANGKATIVEVDEQNEHYTIRHFFPNTNSSELISRVPEWRLIDTDDL